MQVALQASVALLTDGGEWHPCEWKCSENQSGDHPEKHHKTRPSYPEGGNSSRDDGAPAAWKRQNRVPWLWPTKNDGINSLHEDRDYHINRGSPASSYPYPTYATEGHHCISVEIFNESNFPALVHNALLMGYDVNHKNNGFHVPAFVVDIVCHDLQHHASSHTWSEPAPLEYDLDSQINPYLTQLQEWCYGYCSLDWNGDTGPQAKIIDDLNRVSDRIRRNISHWRFFLTKLAKMTLGDLGAYDKDPEEKPKGTWVKSTSPTSGKLTKTRYEYLAKGGLIRKDLKAQVMNKANLMPKDFPDWDYYVTAGMLAVGRGENANEPFSRWISRRMMYLKRLLAAHMRS